MSQFRRVIVACAGIRIPFVCGIPVAALGQIPSLLSVTPVLLQSVDGMHFTDSATKRMARIFVTAASVYVGTHRSQHDAPSQALHPGVWAAAVSSR